MRCLSQFKCNHDGTHRVCAQLLESSGDHKPLSWGQSGDFWEITGQKAWQVCLRRIERLSFEGVCPAAKHHIARTNSRATRSTLARRQWDKAIVGAPNPGDSWCIW